MTYTDNIINAVWEKAKVVDGMDSAMYRLDAANTLIMRAKYGMDNPYGWVIDHVYPRKLGGGDELVNLRAMHIKNNNSKSDDYPSYIAALIFDGVKNTEKRRSLSVNKKLRSELKKLYKGA